MDKDLHDIENLFHAALENNDEETPSPDVWNAVEKKLDKDNIISIKKKYTYLKRVAILLLLLFSGFVLYEINNTNNNNTLAKINNNIKPATSKKINKNATGSNNKTGNNSVIIDTINYKNHKSVFKSSVASTNDKLLKPQPGTINKNSFQKKNITDKKNPEKYLSKNQITFNSTKNQKLTSKPLYKEKRSKSKNVKPANYEQTLAQNDDVHFNHLIPSLETSKNEAIENMQSKDLIDTKKLSPPRASLINKTPDSVNNFITKKKKKTSGFSLTPFFSPDIAWYHLQNDVVSNQQGNVSEIESHEKHEFSYTYGAVVDYRINKHLGLQSGLTLSNTNIIVQPETIYAQKDNTGNIKYRINTSSGYGYVLPSFSANPAVGDSLYAFSSTHSLQYFSIPIALTYNVTKGKFKFNVLAGISPNFLLQATLKTNVEKGFGNETETVNNLLGPKKVYFSGLAGAGVNYTLTGNTALCFAPVMRFALNPINKNSTVKSYPMSLGFRVGLKIEL